MCPGCRLASCRHHVRGGEPCLFYIGCCCLVWWSGSRGEQITPEVSGTCWCAFLGRSLSLSILSIIHHSTAQQHPATTTSTPPCTALKLSNFPGTGFGTCKNYAGCRCGGITNVPIYGMRQTDRKTNNHIDNINPHKSPLAGGHEIEKSHAAWEVG